MIRNRAVSIDWDRQENCRLQIAQNSHDGRTADEYAFLCHMFERIMVTVLKYILFIRRAGRIFTTMFEKDGAEV